MADQIDTAASRRDALSQSTTAALTTAISAAAAVVGILGQLAVHGSVGFAMLSGLSLAVLAAIVFAHQR